MKEKNLNEVIEDFITDTKKEKSKIPLPPQQKEDPNNLIKQGESKK